MAAVEAGQDGRARQQGSAGHRRRADDRRGAAQAARPCCRSTASIMLFSNALRAAACEDVSKIILTASGGPFRTASLDAMRAGDAGAGGGPSQLVDGREDLGRFGDDDEQGAGADRGASSVRPAVGADRHRHPPAVGDPFAGRIRRRLGARAARQSPTCAFRSPMRWPGRSGWRRPAQRLDLASDRHGSTSKRPTSTVFPRCGWPAKRSRPGGAAPIVLNAANEVAVAGFLAGRDRLSPTSPRSSSKRSTTRRCAAPRSIADVLEIDRATRARASSHDEGELPPDACPARRSG